MKTVSELAHDDETLLQAVLDHENLSEEEREAFDSMLRQVMGNNRSLSDRQRSWLKNVAERMDVSEPSANLVSRGKVLRGAEIPTPAILLNRPLKPPGRQ